MSIITNAKMNMTAACTASISHVSKRVFVSMAASIPEPWKIQLWNSMSILKSISSGHYSYDLSIYEYSE